MAQYRDEAGNIWEVGANGQPVLVRAASAPQQPQQPRTIQLPPSPQDMAAEARAQAASGNAAAANARAQAEADRQAREWAATHEPDGTPKPQIASSPRLTAETRQKAIAQAAAADQLDAVIADLRAKFEAGPGATKGIAGLRDYFPTEANQQFDRSANAARGIVRNALGLTGGEANTAAEAQMNLGAYIPQSSDYDATITDSIARLEGIRDSARKQSRQVLGGDVDANGNIIPVATPGLIGDKSPDLGAMVPAMRGTKKVYDPQTTAILNTMYAKGASLDQINGYLGTIEGASKVNPQDWNNWREWSKKHPDYAPFSVTREVPTTAKERSMGALLNNTGGAAAIGAADSASFGLLSRLAPEKVDALRNTQGGAMLAGEMLGAIGGTNLLAKGALKLAPRLGGKLAAKVLANTGKAQFARNLATDATYGGLYGGVAYGDPVGGVVAGALGSAAGQGAGKTVGAAFGGVARAPASETLARLGIDGMTVGQQLGGIAKTAEDKAMSLPGIGDIIRNRRVDSLKSLEDVLQTRAGAPIGVKPDGGSWVDGLPPQFGQAYDNATRGVKVGIDRQLNPDLAALRKTAIDLPPDLKAKFDLAMARRVKPYTKGGTLTGEDYQQAMRGLSGYKAEVTKPGSEEAYRDVLSGVQDALRAQMERGGGGDVVSGLRNADAAYRQAKVIQEAQRRAVNGSNSGVPGLATPAQYNSAALANAKKFGGQRPFADILDAAQEALPSKIPDSGTAGRLIQASAVPAGAAGLGYAVDDKEGALKGLLLSAALAGGGSKGAQKALSKLLFDRPQSARATGALIRKAKGLIGSAMVPFMLESQN